MNESDLSNRLNALEDFVMGRDLAHQQCLLALLTSLDEYKKPIVTELLAALAAQSRLQLPAPAERYFDSALAVAQDALRTSG